jgi:hypothetical protein
MARKKGKTRNRSTAARNRATTHRSRNTHHMRHRSRGRRRNAGGGELTIGAIAAVTAIVINFVSPYVPILSDAGISGALKRGVIGFVIRMVARFMGASGPVVEGITYGAIVAAVIQAFQSFGVATSLPSNVIPLNANRALPASTVQAVGSGQLGYITALPGAGLGNQWDGGMSGIARMGNQYRIVA